MQTPSGFCQLAWDRVGEPWVPGPWGYIRRVLAAFRGQVGAKRPPVGSVSGIRRAGVQWPVCFVWLAKSSSDWQACNDHAKTQAKHLCDIKFFQTQAVARDGPQKETARPCKRQKKRREPPRSTKQRNLWKPRALQNPSSRKHRSPAQQCNPTVVHPVGLGCGFKAPRRKQAFQKEGL